MFVLIVELETDSARCAELEKLLQSLVESAKVESGIIFYSAQRLKDDSNRFILYEYYVDKAAWEAHLQYEPAKELLRYFEALLKSPPKLTFCDLISTTAMG